MEKRYQVFISSTKSDLEEVRRRIALALLDDKFIPVGMEQWGATPLDSWSLIKRFIDQCDYYVLVIAGLYGSIHEEKGLSFTECEYDYAVENNIPVLAFLHESIGRLSGEKLESKPQRRKMLEKFREKVQSKWNVDFWNDERELPRLISSRLNKAVDFFDRPGWVPGNSIKGVPVIVSDSTRTISDLQIRNIFRVPSENPRRDQRMMEVFSEPCTSLALVARSGFSYLHPRGANWMYAANGAGMKSKLEEGIPMEVILENPYSENGQCRRRADGKTDPWRELSWGRLKELVARYPNLKLRFTSAAMPCSLFFTDSSLFYDPYHFGKFPKAEASKNNFFVVEFEYPHGKNEGTNYYNLLKRHFEFVRDDEMTMTFDEFRSTYSELLRREP